MESNFLGKAFKTLNHSLWPYLLAYPTTLPHEHTELQPYCMFSAVKASCCSLPSARKVFLTSIPSLSNQCLPPLPWCLLFLLFHLLDLTIPFSYCCSTFGIYSLKYLGIYCKYLPYAKHCTRDGNKMISKMKPDWNIPSAVIHSDTASFFKLVSPIEYYAPNHIKLYTLKIYCKSGPSTGRQ